MLQANSITFLVEAAQPLLYTANVNTEETKHTSTAAKIIRPSWRHLFKTTEGRLFLLGVAIAFAGLVVLGLVTFWSPHTSSMMGAMVFTNITLGTIVSMSIGYAAGYGHAFVISVNMWVETVVLLLFYPVFVLSMRKLVAFPRLGRFLEHMRATAERHHDKVRRYGIAGLFIFVLFPFWMTGPLVGSAIGFLLGMPAWLTLTVVSVGNLLTLTGWAYLLFSLYTSAATFGPWAPVLIIGLIILSIYAGYQLVRRRRKHG